MTTAIERQTLLSAARDLVREWGIPATRSELEQATDWVITKWEARGFTPMPRAVAVVLRREYRIRK